jgi:hypothetical protein
MKPHTAWERVGARLFGRATGGAAKGAATAAATTGACRNIMYLSGALTAAACCIAREPVMGETYNRPFGLTLYVVAARAAHHPPSPATARAPCHARAHAQGMCRDQRRVSEDITY